MSDLVETLRKSFNDDKEYRDAYAESFMGSWIAAQIKVLREQRGLSQQALAEIVGTKQAGISRLENVNHLAWKVQTLSRLAKAFDLRLKITFEEFGTLPTDLQRFGRDYLRRKPYKEDQVFNPGTPENGRALEHLSEKELAALGGEKKANAIVISDFSKGFGVSGDGRLELDGKGKPAGISRGTKDILQVRSRA